MMNILGMFVLLAVLSFAHSATMVNRNPCPSTYKPGDIWKPFRDHCLECKCLGIGYQCYSCGAYAIYTEPDCYVEVAPPSDPYPDCCNQQRFCVGEAKYNATKHEEYAKKYGYRYF